MGAIHYTENDFHWSAKRRQPIIVSVREIVGTFICSCKCPDGESNEMYPSAFGPTPSKIV